jgi:hypothetical protein
MGNYIIKNNKYKYQSFTIVERTSNYTIAELLGDNNIHDFWYYDLKFIKKDAKLYY